ERQVRIEGTVERIAPEASDAYFQSRPRGSRLGAWTSPQSQEIADRTVLTDRLAAMQERFTEDEPVPRPPHWGGYRVRPHTIEFWQGRRSRLHDRLCYRVQEDQSWTLVRLAP
ncbi:MAG: pyridoxal 5'-phosphate synthase, partial [Bacteroidota bacterium]